jgi:hypothetical protein
MISTCAGIEKYAFYLDFKGDLSSKPQVSVVLYTMNYKFTQIPCSRQVIDYIIISVKNNLSLYTVLYIIQDSKKINNILSFVKQTTSKSVK